MGLVQVAPPDSYPVTLEEAKRHLRVDHSFEDDYITHLIAVSTAFFDGPGNILGRVLAPQTWELTLPAFPPLEIPLVVGPLIDVISVQYLDEDLVSSVVDPASYYENRERVSVFPVSDFSWPATAVVPDSVRVTFESGYEDAPAPSGSPEPFVSTVPIQIRQAILLMIGYFYENREAVGKTDLMPVSGAAVLPVYAAEALIAPFKRWVLA